MIVSLPACVLDDGLISGVSPHGGHDMIKTDRSSGAKESSTRLSVYASLCDALTRGQFVPGEKLTLRSIAGDLNVSLTPIREALQQLVANGALEMEPNRSVRIPLMSRARILELRDIRVALEGLAAEKAANGITPDEIDRLAHVAKDIMAARERGDDTTDRLKIREFYFKLYAAARQPQLLRMIKGLWLQTGPYQSLFYPKFVASPRGPAMRERLLEALRRHDAFTARREIEINISLLLTYIADLADQKLEIARASSRPAGSRVLPSTETDFDTEW
jgi:DNA-binding GntR family transcriptional regulator